MNLLFLLVDICLVAALLVVCRALGGRIYELLGAPEVHPVDYLLFSTGLGMGALGGILCVIGLMGLIEPVILLILLAGSLAWGYGTLLNGDLVYLVRRFREITERPWWTAGGLLSLFLALVLLAGAPPIDWDSLTYHLDVPSHFLRRGDIHGPENNMHAGTIGAMHMMYLPLLQWGTSAAPALFNTFIAGLLTLTVCRLVHRLVDPTIGSFTALLVWGSPVLLLVAVTPRVDVTMAWCLLLGHYALLVTPSGKRVDSHLLLTAGLLGIAISIKANAALYVVGMLPLFFVLSKDKSASRFQLRHALILGLGCMLPLVPWLVKNVLLFGSALRPLLAPSTLEPWVADFLPGHEMVVSEAWAVRPIRQIREPFNLLHFFLAPGKLTPEGEGILYVGNPILALLPAWFFARRKRILAWIGIPAVIYVLLLLLRSPFVNMRYLIPAIIPLTIVAGASVGGRLKGSLTVRTAVLAGCLLPLGVALISITSRRPVIEFVSGGMSPQQFRSESLFLGDIMTDVDGVVPPEGKLLLLYETRGYLFEPAVVQDNVLENWRWLMEADRHQPCLKDSGITHVLVNTQILGLHLERGLDREAAGLEELDAFLERCAKLVKEEPGYWLYELGDRESQEPGTGT